MLASHSVSGKNYAASLCLGALRWTLVSGRRIMAIPNVGSREGSVRGECAMTKPSGAEQEPVNVTIWYDYI